MARARYIYVVVWSDDEGPEPQAAFTVKRELEAYLEDHLFDYVLRFRDGQHDHVGRLMQEYSR